MDDISQYRSIGWDFDQTLWGHESSPHFWDYITRNPHGQFHYIVTFRTGRLFKHLWHDLARAECKLLPLNFRGIFGVSEAMYFAAREGLPGGEEFSFWKGQVCRDHDIECLIDDATMEVWAGCSRYDIAYVHPDCIDIEDARLTPFAPSMPSLEPQKTTSANSVITA